MANAVNALMGAFTLFAFLEQWRWLSASTLIYEVREGYLPISGKDGLLGKYLLNVIEANIENQFRTWSLLEVKLFSL